MKPLKKAVKLSVNDEGVEKVTREREHHPLRRQAQVTDEDPSTSITIGNYLSPHSAYDILNRSSPSGGESDVDSGDPLGFPKNRKRPLISQKSLDIDEKDGDVSLSSNSLTVDVTKASAMGASSTSLDSAISSSSCCSNSCACDAALPTKSFPCTPPVSKGRPRKHPFKPGKYECHYCGVKCSKPSVLEKHIRAHTNERPFPCELCNLFFKTKSNLYKHEKSNAHQSKLLELRERDPAAAEKYAHRQLSLNMSSNESFEGLTAGSCGSGYSTSFDDTLSASRMTSFDSSTTEGGSRLASFEHSRSLDRQDSLPPSSSNLLGASLNKFRMPPLRPDSIGELFNTLQSTIAKSQGVPVLNEAMFKPEDSASSSASVGLLPPPQPDVTSSVKQEPINVGASVMLPKGQPINTGQSIVAYLRVDQGVGGPVTVPVKIDPSFWKLYNHGSQGCEGLQLILGTTSLNSSSSANENPAAPDPPSSSCTNQESVSIDHLLTNQLTPAVEVELENKVRRSSQDLQAAQTILQMSTPEKNERKVQRTLTTDEDVSIVEDGHIDSRNKIRPPSLQHVGKAFSFEVDSLPPFTMMSFEALDYCFND